MRESGVQSLPTQPHEVCKSAGLASRAAMCPPVARVSAFSFEDSAMRGFAITVLTMESAVFAGGLRAFFFGIYR
jgi:hypothetical protein